VTLPTRVNRATNLVVAAVYIPVMVFNVAGASADWALYYGLTIGVEVLILAFILRSAWTWPRTHSESADVATVDRRRQQARA
jgi:low affinity Fe/Cu permease